MAAIVTETKQSFTLEAIVAEIAKTLQPFKKTDAPLGADTDISRDLNMDSLAVMDLLMELEDKFDVSIPLNMVPEIATVGELAKTIMSSKTGA